MDRKYKQKGYRDHDPEERKRERSERKPPEPRPKQQPHDMLGPRTPRMVGTVTRARCSSCGAALPPNFDVNSECPKCHAAIHSCKQCVHFDTGRQFECTEPVPVRFTKKDAQNNCSFFAFRMTVEKDTSPVNYAKSTPAPAMASAGPKDARKAFEDLFKK